MPIQTIHQDGDNGQLRSVIFNSTPKAVEQTKSIAKDFKGKTELDTCKNVFDFLKNKIRYRADGWHQQVKLPSALLREKVGDCKSYSVFTYAILTNLGIPCKYVLTSYNQDPTPSHIYVVTDSGIIIDAVWGIFNNEKKPTYKYYKKIDMKISTITGVHNKGSLIGACESCESKGIGDASLPSYHKGSYNPSFKSGTDWYRVRRVQDKGAKSLSAGARAELELKERGLKLFRGVILQFIKANGGGVANALYNSAFREIPKKLPIPYSVSESSRKSISDYAKSIGVKIPTESQKNAIKNLVSLQIVGYEGSGLKRKPILKAKMTLKEAYERVLGKGQYERNEKYASFVAKENKKIEEAYTIPKASEEGKKRYYDGLQVEWFWLGGNPEDLTQAIIEGNQKSPRGKSANYMLWTAKTRGLSSKDLGLIIRGFTSAFAGDKFSYSDDGAYILGTKGIGLTGAEVGAWVLANLKLILALFSLIAGILKTYQGTQDAKTKEDEINKLLGEGWVTEEDYLSFPLPRPKTQDVKSFEIPTAELDGMALLNLALEFSEKSSKAKEVEEEAKQDKNTSEFLEQVVKVGGQVTPKEGFKNVTLVKVDPKLKEGIKAGFDIALPLLIGAGVIIALNTAKKQK